jgi:hypothetical protein
VRLGDSDSALQRGCMFWPVCEDLFADLGGSEIGYRSVAGS